MIIFIKSFIVGICALIPGVSGSVIAVSLDLYDRVIEIISDIEKIKKNKKFLFYIFFGLLTGIYFTSVFLVYFFKYKTILYYCLIGIILSEIPFLIKKIHNKHGEKIHVIPLLVAFITSLILDYANKQSFLTSYSFFKYFFGGILFSFGKVFPGISSSFFLLSLGIYENIIILITKPILLIINFKFYIPFILGTIIGLIIFIKLLLYLINNKYGSTYSVIIGLVLSSALVLLSNYSLDFENFIGFILSIISFLLFMYIKKKNDN